MELLDRNGDLRTCINLYRGAMPNLIRCNLSEIQKIENIDGVLSVLVFHEMLGLIGVERTVPKHPVHIEGYQHSKKLTSYLYMKGQIIVLFL